MMKLECIEKLPSIEIDSIVLLYLFVCNYYISLMVSLDWFILIYMSVPTKQEQLVIARLKKIREEAQLSQLELSYRSGVSQNMITYIETGKRTPTLSTLLKLCNALNINPSVLFMDTNEDKEQAKQQIIELIQRHMT